MLLTLLIWTSELVFNILLDFQGGYGDSHLVVFAAIWQVCDNLLFGTCPGALVYLTSCSVLYRVECKVCLSFRESIWYSLTLKSKWWFYSFHWWLWNSLSFVVDYKLVINPEVDERGRCSWILRQFYSAGGSIHEHVISSLPFCRVPCKRD